MSCRATRSLAIALTLGAVASCSSGHQSSAPASPASPSRSLAGPTPTVIPIPGKVTGRVHLHDAIWGDLVVLTSVVYNSGDFENTCGQAHLRVVDAAQRVRLRRDWDWGCGDLRPYRPPTDSTGNVFLYYNPGRYDGVIVLRAAGGKLVDFGTLPPSSNTRLAAVRDDYEGSGPFGYYAEARPDPTSRGRLEIKQFDNNCTPDCAGGTITSTVFRWDGHRYVRQRAG